MFKNVTLQRLREYPKRRFKKDKNILLATNKTLFNFYRKQSIIILDSLPEGSSFACISFGVHYQTTDTLFRKSRLNHSFVNLDYKANRYWG